MIRLGLLAALIAFAYKMWKRARFDWTQAEKQFEDFLAWQFDR